MSRGTCGCVLSTVFGCVLIGVDVWMCGLVRKGGCDGGQCYYLAVTVSRQLPLLVLSSSFKRRHQHHNVSTSVSSYAMLKHRADVMRTRLGCILGSLFTYGLQSKYHYAVKWSARTAAGPFM